MWAASFVIVKLLVRYISCYFFFTLVEVNIHKCKSATITCNVAALFNLYELLRPQLKDKRQWWDRPSNVIKRCSCKLYYLTDEGWTWYGAQCTVYVCAGVIVNWCLCGYVKLSIVATQLLCLMLVLGFAEKKKRKMIVDLLLGLTKVRVQAVYTSGRA